MALQLGTFSLHSFRRGDSLCMKVSNFVATCEEAANVKECRVESMGSLRVYKVRLRVKGLGHA